MQTPNPLHPSLTSQQKFMGKSWSELLPELLELISDRLPLVDYISFRGVCHRWRSTPSGRSEITNFSKKTLWILFYDCQIGSSSNGDGAKCYLYSESHPKSCTIRLPHLRGATVVYSNSGWLLAQRNNQFFFYNPFTFEKIDLPKHAIAKEQVYVFVNEPSDPNCAVFIVSRWKEWALEVSKYIVGDHDTKWTTNSLEVGKDQIDRLIGITSCSCKIGEDCPCRSKIFIFSPKNIVPYDYTSNLVFQSQARRPDLNKKLNSLIKDSYERICTHHRGDWLHKFGGNGRMAVSVCSISAHPLMDVTVKRMTYAAGTMSIAVCDQVEDKQNLVKATWIEPTFGSKGMS